MALSIIIVNPLIHSSDETPLFVTAVILRRGLSDKRGATVLVSLGHSNIKRLMIYILNSFPEPEKTSLPVIISPIPLLHFAAVEVTVRMQPNGVRHRASRWSGHNGNEPNPGHRSREHSPENSHFPGFTRRRRRCNKNFREIREH